MPAVREFIQYRPFCVIGLILALQNVLYGIGYIVPTIGFSQTVLFKEMTMLISAEVAGGIFLSVGFVMAYSALKQKNTLVRKSFFVNSTLWLFALFIYTLHGTPFLGMAIAGTFFLLSSYIGLTYGNRKAIAARSAYKSLSEGELP